MTEDKKRKAEEHVTAPLAKRKDGKNKRKWQIPRKATAKTPKAAIKFGDAGIWVTCLKGKEGRCRAEMSDMLDEYSRLMDDRQQSPVRKDDAEKSDIEADIASELRDMKEQTTSSLFEAVKVDTPCVIFFKVRAPLDPAALVHRICDDAYNSRVRQRSRYIQRLTPVTITGKADESGLDEVAKTVLGPHFHQTLQETYKYAIRPTIRNHTLLARNGIIERVAAAVGSPHIVDLKHYDRLILVEIWKNVCGMSVVGGDYEELKRYNLLEIYKAVTDRTEAST